MHVVIEMKRPAATTLTALGTILKADGFEARVLFYETH